MRDWKLIILGIFILIGTSAFAQKSVISGQVIDANTGKAMGYTNIALLNTSNEIVTGQVTSEDGRFKFEALPGTYTLRVKFISYKSAERTVTIDEDNIDVGKIAMKEDVDQLSEVVVEAEKAQMEMKLDKRVYNIGKDLSNIGGNAESILDNLPSVNVDVEGNIALRGSQNVKVLINGRPSGLVGIDGASALKQIPADLIESIEVITNPSARYQAEGNAGIINIVLKKSEKAGINGSFSANLGYPTILGGSANLNYRKDKLNFFGSYGFRYDENFGGGYRDQTNFNSDNEVTDFLYNDIDRNRSDISHNFRFGIDYNLTESSIITGSFLYRDSDEENNTYNNRSYFTQSRVLEERDIRSQLELEEENVLEYSVNFTKTFPDDEDHKLTADVQYRQNTEIEDSDIITDTLNFEDGEYYERDFQTSLIDEFSDNLLIQSSYIKPIGEDQSVELGWRSNLRTITNSYNVNQLQDDGTFESLGEFTNDFIYQENIHALYAIYNKEWEKISVQGGLRMEYTDIKTDFGDDADSLLLNRDPYANLFPSVFLTYKLNKITDLQASYSRRFDRPGFRSLNPFSNFSDNTNIRIGNPNLNPEFTDSYELGIMNNFKNATLYTGIYFRSTDGLIERVNTLRVSALNDTVIFRQPQNIGVRNAVGIENTYSHDINNWWRLNGNVNIFYSQTQGNYTDDLENEISLDAQTFTMSSRLSSQFTFWDDFNFQLSGFYRAPEREPQRYRKTFYMIDLGLSKELFDGKGTLSLSVRDLLNSRKWRTTTSGTSSDGSSFEYESEFQWRTRTFRLTFDYRLKSNKKKENAYSEGQLDDE